MYKHNIDDNNDILMNEVKIENDQDEYESFKNHQPTEFQRTNWSKIFIYVYLSLTICLCL